LDEKRSVSIGVGAHITAASEGGYRYGSNMTPEERSSPANGIWLCYSCSKLIDSDEKRYTVALLHEWKKNAVQRAQEAIAGGRPLGPVRPDIDLDDADIAFLRGLDLPTIDAVEAVGVRLRAAIKIDIAAFRAARPIASRTIPLTLTLRDKPLPTVTLESVARLMGVAEAVAIVASGGTGKSTSIVQLAEHLAATDGALPLVVPLGEWSDRQDDFFDFTLRRNAFGTFRRQHLMQLAYHGKLALLLDGWNELTLEARLRAIRDLRALQRDYPQIGLVVTSRRGMLPVQGPIIDIEPLSHEQQMDLARSLRGEEGIKLVDRAWRTPGLVELTGIPLYLNALLALPAGTSFPETKEAVLRMFVQHNEAPPERIEQLERDTFGHHSDLLVAVAVEANRAANTVVSDNNANRTVSTVVRMLSDDGQIQIGSTPQPRVIIDSLVNAHLLVRAPGPDGAIRFQHQLFQEWYASSEVEQLMLASAAGRADARTRLREEVLNWPSWEESILFACDRLSRLGDQGARAVAATVDETLGIDALLAAAMLCRASDAVWALARDRVRRVVHRWHIPGKVDRAVRFMIVSGKPEFAELVWPLISSDNNQIQFRTLRLADRFRPSVLGADAEARLRALPTPQREIALHEIASQSGFDGMDLAVRLASSDPDTEVVVSVIEALAFRRGDRHVVQIMRTASDTTWAALARKRYPEHLADTELDSRLARERLASHAAETNPSVLLDRIVDERPADAEARITRLISASPDDFKDAHFDHAIARANAQYPSAVAAGLVARIAAGSSLPYAVTEFLKEAPVRDSGAVAGAALDPTTPDRRLMAAAAVSGPTTVAALVDQLISIDDQLHTLARYDEALSKARYRLIGALTATQQKVFFPILITKGNTRDSRRIGLLPDVFARHGGERGAKKPPIGSEHQTPLRALLEAWMETLRTASEPQRHVASEVARAAERLANPELAEPLRKLLERDLDDYAAERAGRRADPSAPHRLDGTGYTLMYTRAFVAMREEPAVRILKAGLSDLRWGIDAAGALLQIWSSSNQPPKEGPLFGWTSFPNHLLLRSQRDLGTPPTSEFAEAIFEIVRALGHPDKTEAEQHHALGLAVTGLGLPHGTKRPEIDLLLALPQPIIRKHRLLVAAARAGEIVPAVMVMDGLRDLLAAAQTQAWRLDENRGEFMGWIDLFPFTDDPSRVHEALALLPEPHRRPYALRRLLETLPQSPAAPALATLERLATDNRAFLQEFEWTNALIKLDTEQAALALLGHVCAGRVPLRDGFRISNALATWAGKYPSVRTALLAQYRAWPAGHIRQVLEMTMDDMSDEDVLMALFESNVGSANAKRGLSRVIKNISVGRRPVEGWDGAFEEFGLPLTNLRARLFAMLPANDARASLAKECLIAIEWHRDERGRVSSEPRHPDISTGRPWPPEASETPWASA
jgi:hypothetical protein